jgi:hypothetical protein
MRKMLAALLAIGVLVPMAALAETWEKVPLIDQMCAKKEKVTAHPENHPTGCLIKCSDSGYGVMTSDGKYLKLDEAGNKKALAALKETKKENDVRVNVTGEQKGDTIAVQSLKIVD